MICEVNKDTEQKVTNKVVEFYQFKKVFLKLLVPNWDDPEGWDGEEGGRGVQDGEYM